MKAILEFNLDEPDDEKAHLRCVKAMDMACLLHEISRIIYFAGFAIEEVGSEIRNAIDASEINIDEMLS